MVTPLRSVRVADDVWMPALERARGEGTTVTAVIVEHLTNYGRASEDDER